MIVIWVSFFPSASFYLLVYASRAAYIFFKFKHTYTDSLSVILSHTFGLPGLLASGLSHCLAELTFSPSLAVLPHSTLFLSLAFRVVPLMVLFVYVYGSIARTLSAWILYDSCVVCHLGRKPSQSLTPIFQALMQLSNLHMCCTVASSAPCIASDTF